MKHKLFLLMGLLSVGAITTPTPTIAHSSDVTVDVQFGHRHPRGPRYYPAPRRRVVREEIYYDPVPVDAWPGPLRRGRVHWVSNRARSFPRNVVSGGHEGADVLYVCRAWYGGGLHPGKVVAGNCNITYGGREIIRKRYQILAGRRFSWVYASFGNVPPGAVVGGYERDRLLYVCQASYAGGVHPGKIVGRYCNIGYGGREIRRSRYNVLVRD